ncbi:GyrI-like domain-containing protein [Pseudomonas sp. B2M1-30]|uniref:GyrI-like domain-containing protein n=1 Tax=Pseudomonas TaxID=286 RepID=UPI0021C917CA|nr:MULTISPECIES: GyrI-like domain-containing protein [Pseudomonas]MCU0117587.1 GyrI-like domain-containing protein [Pseudomonas sp. B2M1-30]MCU7259123.1 GyrI-like domain-containing protein [Pseudomonas koreensis]
MDVKQQHVDPFTVSGLRVRTTNAAEHNAETAKIGPMWGRFFAEGLAQVIPGKLTESPVYGVYSAYESDASGAFDVTAGVAVTDPSTDFETIRIESGDYLVFSASGAMPDTVISTWGYIWNHFQTNPHLQRRFATDFEAYTGPESVSIYIGVR